jgi:hypothetical protein
MAETAVMEGLGLAYLHGYWARMLRVPGAPEGPRDLDHALLCGLRVGLLETMRFLHDTRPNFESFERGIVERNGGVLDGATLDRLRRALEGEIVGPEVSLEGVEGLSADELRQWDEEGYAVLRAAVPREQARAAEAAIYEFLGMDPAEPDSWYGRRLGHSIWVSMVRHPAFWANRRSPRMMKAFAQLWGREDLWVTVDQGGLNPPERPGWAFPGPHLHWDTTLAEPHHLGVQGILYLADVAEDQGAFMCVPGFHRRIKEWMAGLPAGADPRVEGLKIAGARPIAASAGDMVIWNNLLPHGSSPNRNTRPRVAQYISMAPTRWAHHEVWM